MVEIKIDLKKCTGEGTCVDTCPVNLFELKDGKAKVKGNLDECIVCRACEASCPTGAIEVVD